MIDQKNSMNETEMGQEQEGPNIVVDFARFYDSRGAESEFLELIRYSYTYDEK